MDSSTTSKLALYAQTEKEILSILDGEGHVIAQMATIACCLSHAFPENIWTGFYLVDPQKDRELVVGPYQGTLGCLRIPFDRGVCGAAAATGQTQLVHDVHAFPGHIACDSRSVSEIVVPVVNKDGDLIAVLDIDNPEAGAFDAVDQQALEALVLRVFG